MQFFECHMDMTHKLGNEDSNYQVSKDFKASTFIFSSNQFVVTVYIIDGISYISVLMYNPQPLRKAKTYSLGI